MTAPEPPPTQIVLIGAPGSGKSTVGVLLAAALGLPFADVDELIEQAAGKPVGEIFADHGEPHFRALEVTHTLAALEGPGVLSLGGGAVTQEPVRAALAGRTVVWLQVSAAAAARRVGLTTARPLLLGNVRGQLVRLLEQRTPVYAAAATHPVATDEREPAEVVAEVLAALAVPTAPRTPGSDA